MNYKFPKIYGGKKFVFFFCRRQSYEIYVNCPINVVKKDI